MTAPKGKADARPLRPPPAQPAPAGPQRRTPIARAAPDSPIQRFSDPGSGRHTTAGNPPALLTEALELTLRGRRAWLPPRARLSRLHPGDAAAPLARGVGAQKTINHVQGFQLRVELPPQHLPSLAVAGAGDQLPACLADEPHVAAGQAPPAAIPPSPDHLFYATIVRMFEYRAKWGAEQTCAEARRIIRSGPRRLDSRARSSRGDGR